jgi:hypothetical protein
MLWPPSVACTIWNVSRKRCGMPEPAQRGQRPLGPAAGAAGVVRALRSTGGGVTLPKETSKRDALALQIGADGYALMDGLGVTSVHSLCATCRRWRFSGRFGCSIITAVLCLAWKPSGGAAPTSKPPASLLIQSPYDVEARYSQKRETQWWAIRCISVRPVMWAARCDYSGHRPHRPRRRIS